MIVIAIAAALLAALCNASAAFFEQGALAAPVAVLTVGDPLVGVGLGILWLGESVRTTW